MENVPLSRSRIEHAIFRWLTIPPPYNSADKGHLESIVDRPVGNGKGKTSNGHRRRAPAPAVGDARGLEKRVLAIALRSARESSSLVCCGHSSGTAATRESSRIASPWHGRPDRSGPAAVLLRQRSPSRLLAARERSEKPPSATAWVQRVIRACGSSWQRPMALRY